MFLAGARFYYGTGGERETSFGQLIKKKLSEFLSQMIELETIDEIKTEFGPAADGSAVREGDRFGDQATQHI